MEEEYRKLLEAIREKCRRDHWYGPDLLSPRQYDGALETDPNFDRHTLDMLDPDDPNCFGFVFPPASPTDLEETEQKLGFALPPLLRTLYVKLANGGFGPGLGILIMSTCKSLKMWFYCHPMNGPANCCKSAMLAAALKYV